MNNRFSNQGVSKCLFAQKEKRNLSKRKGFCQRVSKCFRTQRTSTNMVILKIIRYFTFSCFLTKVQTQHKLTNQGAGMSECAFILDQYIQNFKRACSISDKILFLCLPRHFSFRNKLSLSMEAGVCIERVPPGPCTQSHCSVVYYLHQLLCGREYKLCITPARAPRLPSL